MLGALKLAIISEGVNSWPLYVAQSKSLFAREGIEADVTLTGSSARQLEQLTAGGFDIGFQQSDHVVRAVERGADLFIFMAHAHAPELTLVAAPGTRSFAGLRGRVLAVDGARSGYALLLRKLLADNGLRDGDYTFMESGGAKQRCDALKNGAAVASFLNPPFDRRLIAEGFMSLSSTAECFPTYPGPIAAARRSWAREHGHELLAFIRAMRAAHRWLTDRRNRNEAVQVLCARLDTDPVQAAAAFDAFAERPQPQITAAGLRQVIETVWEADGFRHPRRAPENYMDLGYLARAEQCG